MNEWHDLFVATAGAAAALTGLIFVGVSINLARILSIPKLPGRALLSLILLMTILIISIVLLIRQPSIKVTGIEVLIIGLCCWLFALRIDISIHRNTAKEFKNLNLFNLLFDQTAVLPYLIAAIFFISSSDVGFYWIVIAFILSFIKAMADVWVLLI
jgi:modulator of FtsH protease